MRYLLLASTLLATPVMAQNLAPFASQNCPGQTFFTDFRSGIQDWQTGTWVADSANAAFLSYMAPTQDQTVATGAEGLVLSILPAQGTPTGVPWLAGGLTTLGKFSQQFGYFEISVYIPASMEANGMSWAFWLYGGQPGSKRELDIAEFYAATMDGAIHSNYSGDNSWSFNLYNFPSGGHVFAANWTKDVVEWYVDTELKGRSTTIPPDFQDAPMFMILGTAATKGDTGWTSAPASGSSASLQVYYVRAFKDMASALACVPHTTTTATTQQLDAVNTQVQQLQAQTDQQTKVPSLQPTTTTPPPSAPPPVSSPPPAPTVQTLQPAPQAPTTLQQLAAELAAVQAQIQNFMVPTALSTNSDTASTALTPNPTPQTQQSTKHHHWRHHDTENDGDADDQ